MATPAADASLPPEPRITRETAADILFLPGVTRPDACVGGDDEIIRCLIRTRYAGDPEAATLATDLYAGSGAVAGVEVERTMDGGYRGMLHLVPALPSKVNRVHLAHVVHAFADYEAFFSALLRDHEGRIPYRWRALAVRFFRSVKARTPSAYASGWTVAYNLAGSLNINDDSVRETLFHEIFHLNDAAHDDWSRRTLKESYDTILARCGTSTACLAPFAPGSTKVRGGTYYAFQPGNDVAEYAAELAIRYYREQRGALSLGPKVVPPFKCMRPENARAWAALVQEFFAGIDHTSGCW
ncbi:hypothetical protein LZC95_34815 [Pendulispora brunnea]|uniref:Uncharacterized protein n=1 Tax=Pendulispora brunnea TaxID=2905690 RepID=A0ABZ2JYQ0_9BACT